jgi:hypothetical protein
MPTRQYCSKIKKEKEKRWLIKKTIKNQCIQIRVFVLMKKSHAYRWGFVAF